MTRSSVPTLCRLCQIKVGSHFPHVDAVLEHYADFADFDLHSTRGKIFRTYVRIETPLRMVDLRLGKVGTLVVLPM